jgi:hypothetical protein
MSDRTDTGLPTPWVWVFAVGYSILVLGAGVWVSAATGNWFVVLLAVGLTAPVEVLLLRRHRRRAAAGAGSQGRATRHSPDTRKNFESSSSTASRSSN